MKKLLRWLGVLVISLPVIGFAIANRQSVTLSLDPLSPSQPALVMELPLFVLLLGAIFIGIIIGGIASWLNQGKWRRAARDARTEAEQWRSEIQRLSQTANAQDAGRSGDGGGTLPPPSLMP